MADCVSFFKTTVTPCPSTTVVTITNTATASAQTITNTVSASTVSTSTPISTIVSTLTSTVYTTTSAIIVKKRSVDVEDALYRRAATTTCPASSSPNSVPTYASACSGTARYSSACSCNGVKPSTVSLTAATVTSTSLTAVTVTPTSTQTITVIATSVAVVSASTTVITTAIVSTGTSSTSICSTFLAKVTAGPNVGNYLYIKGDLALSQEGAGPADASTFYLDDQGLLYTLSSPNVYGGIGDPLNYGRSYISFSSDPGDGNRSPLTCRIVNPMPGTPGTLMCSGTVNGKAYPYFAFCQDEDDLELLDQPAATYFDGNYCQASTIAVIPLCPGPSD